MFALAESMDHIGPMTRTVEDASWAGVVMNDIHTKPPSWLLEGTLTEPRRDTVRVDRLPAPVTAASASASRVRMSNTACSSRFRLGARAPPWISPPRHDAFCSSRSAIQTLMID